MSSKNKILVVQAVHQSCMDLLKNQPNFDIEITDDDSESNLKSKIVDCDAISLRTAQLSAEILNEAKKLKIISRHGVGYDNIDLKKAKEWYEKAANDKFEDGSEKKADEEAIEMLTHDEFQNL